MKNLVKKSSISLQLCDRMIEEAIEKANEIGIKVSIHIVDESGVIKKFSRMDGAPLVSIDIARKKAVTAVGYGFPTGESWYNFVKDDPILFNGAQNITDFIMLGGGSPIVIEDQIIGAIGVSGGHYKQDEECVNASLEII